MFKKGKPKESVRHSRVSEQNETGYGRDNAPFFVLGCVRSGTTLLRDLLRIHPRLEAPEETHFFRWADPYASPRYEKNYIGAKLFRKHREIDGISDFDFHMYRYFARNRRELSDFYGLSYLKSQNNIDGRWFDKTPQNVYGILLLSYMYPDAKFLHIYRNPLNVVASLKEGRVMAKHDVKGGINYWMESMIIINEYMKSPGGKERFHEICYENLVSDPKSVMGSILEFLKEDPAVFDFSLIKTHKEKDKYKKVLSATEIGYIKEMCEPFYSLYGYR